MSEAVDWFRARYGGGSAKPRKKKRDFAASVARNKADAEKAAKVPRSFGEMLGEGLFDVASAPQSAVEYVTAETTKPLKQELDVDPASRLARPAAPGARRAGAAEDQAMLARRREKQKPGASEDPVGQFTGRAGAALNFLPIGGVPMNFWMAGKDVLAGPATARAEGKSALRGLYEGVQAGGSRVARDAYALWDPVEAGYANETLDEQSAESRIAKEAGRPEAALGLKLATDLISMGAGPSALKRVVKRGASSKVSADIVAETRARRLAKEAEAAQNAAKHPLEEVMTQPPLNRPAKLPPEEIAAARTKNPPNFNLEIGQAERAGKLTARQRAQVQRRKMQEVYAANLTEQPVVLGKTPKFATPEAPPPSVGPFNEIGAASPKAMIAAGGAALGAAMVAAAPEDRRAATALQLAGLVGAGVAGRYLTRWATGMGKSALADSASASAMRVAERAQEVRRTGSAVTKNGWNEGAAATAEGLTPEEAAARVEMVASSNVPRGGMRRTKAENAYYKKHGQYPPPAWEPMMKSPLTAKYNAAVAKHGEAMGDPVRVTWIDRSSIKTGDQTLGKIKQGVAATGIIQPAHQEFGAALGEMLISGPSLENAIAKGATPGTLPMQKILGMIPSPEERSLFVKALDGDAAAMATVAADTGTLKEAVFAGREWLDSMAHILKIAPGKRLKDYLPHIFDRDTALQNAIDRMAELKKIGLKGDAGAVKEYKGLEGLVKGLKKQPEGYIPDWVLRDSDIPDEALFGSMRERLANLGGYITEPEELFSIYAKGAFRKAMYDKVAPELQKIWEEVRAGRALDSVTGKPVPVDKSFKQFFRNYLDNFAGTQSKSAKGTFDADIFPEFSALDPVSHGAVSDFFATWNHHLLLGTNPSYAFRNMIQSPGNTIGLIGFGNTTQGIADLPKFLDKNGRLARFARAKGLSSSLPHEEWTLVAGLKKQLKDNRAFSLMSHGSEATNRMAAFAGGVRFADKQWAWVEANAKLLFDPARADDAVAAFRKSGRIAEDARFSPAEQLDNVKAAYKNWLASGKDEAVKDAFVADTADFITRQSQHAYGAGAPTGAVVSTGQDSWRMMLMYNTWFTKQANFFWTKLTPMGKAKFLAYNVAVGGVQSAPAIQWLVGGVPQIKDWVSRHVTDPDDQLLPQPVKLVLGGALGQVVPNMESALGLGSVPNIVSQIAGTDEGPAKDAKFTDIAGRITGAIGQGVGGPVLGSAAKAATNVIGSGIEAPLGKERGLAMQQAAEKQRLPVPRVAESGIKWGARELGLLPPQRASAKEKGIIPLIFGKTTRKAGWQAAVRAQEAFDEEKVAARKLVIDAAIQKFPGDLNGAMKYVEESGVEASAEQVMNRAELMAVPSEFYWPVFGRKMDGSDSERALYQKGIRIINDEFAGAPWAPKATAKLTENIARSQYEAIKDNPAASWADKVRMYVSLKRQGVDVGLPPRGRREQMVFRAEAERMRTGRLSPIPQIRKLQMEFVENSER